MGEDEQAAADPFAAETARLADLLRTLVRRKGVSIRSIEKKIGVAESLVAKILRGKITLHVRHVLMICSAIDVDWRDFFAYAYGMAGEPLTASALSEEERLERKVASILTRFGVITEERAKELLSRREPVALEAEGRAKLKAE